MCVPTFPYTASNSKPNCTKVQLPFPWNEAIMQPIQLDMFMIERGPEIEKTDRARRQTLSTASKIQKKRSHGPKKHNFGTVINLLMSRPKSFIFVV